MVPHSTDPGRSRVPDPRTPVEEWLRALAAPTAGPAGGAAAAIVGALAAALVEMVARMTLARERYADVHPVAAEIAETAAGLRAHIASIAPRDAETFAAFGAALALPNATAEEKRARLAVKDATLRAGAAVQLELLGALAQVAEHGALMAERGLAGAVGDAATAVFLAAGAGRSAFWAIRSNLEHETDRIVLERTTARAREWLELIEGVERRVRQLLHQRVR